MIRIRVFDTETTGLGYNAKVVECGYHDLINDGRGWEVDRVASAVFNVHALGVRCAPDAFAVHGIGPAEIEAGWPYDMLDKFIYFSLDKDTGKSYAPDVYAAHNFTFDAKFFKFDKPAICTMKCAKYLWKHAPSYKNGELAVWKGLTIDAQLHRVIPDTAATAGLLKLMLTEDGKTPEQLVQITGGKLQSAESGYRPFILNFGIHKGKTLNAVPEHYLKWIIDDSTCRDDVKDLAAKELEKRR